MKHTEQTDKLAEAIAMQWGSDFGVGTRVTTESGYAFRADEGYSRYTITLPNTLTTFYEDSGRPFTTRTKPDVLTVRCLDDAPDCFWYVGLDGWYEGFREPFNVLTGERR